MADVNNKLRLDIVTELDAAGIKATKDQVDKLELGLRRSGNSGEDAGKKFGKLEKALGSLPGPIGKIGGALGGMAGQITMVIGVFKLGFELGKKIREFWDEWVSGAKEAKEAEEELKKQTEELAAFFEKMASRRIEFIRAQSAETANAIKKIDDQTAAYFRQATSLEGMRKAQGNAEQMLLERSKFEDMRAYVEAGYSEAAEQLGRAYDVAIEELRVKQQLEAFDRESVKLAVDREKAEEKVAKAKERVRVAQAKIDEAERDMGNIKRNVPNNPELGVRKIEQQKKVIEAAQKELERVQAVEAKQREKLETVDADILAREMERANIAASGALAVDRAAAAYDDYVAANGNPLGVQIDPNWSAELLKASTDSYNTQKELLAVLKVYADRMEGLLEMK